MVRRDPDKVQEPQVGLNPDTQKFISLLDLDFEIIVEEATARSPLLNSGLPIRLDIGYAAEDNWPEKFPHLNYVGTPKRKPT